MKITLIKDMIIIITLFCSFAFPESATENEKQDSKVGLVLSGGGAKGLRILVF